MARLLPNNSCIILASILVVSLASQNVLAQVVDITKHGAVGNGQTDCADALSAAFKEACESTTPSTILIPKGDFSVSQVKLVGPCKSAISIDLQGTLVALTEPIHPDPKSDWITIQRVDGFSLFGPGSMDGQGKTAWDKKMGGAKLQLMAMFNMAFVNNVDIRDVTFKQAKNTHVHIFACKNVTMTKITIDSPAESPNTDGVKMGASSDIKILDSNLMSGDDCVAILTGTERLTVTNTRCGPGHGISVGSMGNFPNEKDISGIHIKNCTFVGTDNGVRIKTWQDKYAAIGTDIRFEDIIMEDVINPIIIDQEYCPAANCGGKAPSKVKISKVVFKNIKGTSKTENAVKLICSQAVPCEGVEISDINLTFNGGKSISSCSNVKPILLGLQIPQICGAPLALKI